MTSNKPAISSTPEQLLYKDTRDLIWTAMPTEPIWLRFTDQNLLHVRNTQPEMRHLSYYSAAHPDMPLVEDLQGGTDFLLMPTAPEADLFIDEHGTYLQVSSSAPGLVYAVIRTVG